MKNGIKIIVSTILLLSSAFASVMAQGKLDEQRMERDVAVAENVLSTLLQQQLGKRNSFLMEVQGSYLPGFGVTFRLPTEFANQLMMMDAINSGNVSGTVTINGYSGPDNDISGPEDAPAPARITPSRNQSIRLTPDGYRTQSSFYKKHVSDSLRNSYNFSIIQAAKEFIADYGDMITQLTPEERIVITNKMIGQGGGNNWLLRSDAGIGRSVISVEVSKADLTQFKQGKLSRDQFFAKIHSVNAENAEEVSPDLEVLSSMFNRLYRADLSKTYYLQEEVDYERLKDYGVIYDMHAYSSFLVAEDFLANGNVRRLYDMPTLQLSAISKDERSRKVKELYPAFERGIIDDVLEYGKTLKSLKDDELIVFNIRLTECKGCNIPSSLEISFKESVLKDYSSGKLSKEAAIAKGVIKKGPTQ